MRLIPVCPVLPSLSLSLLFRSTKDPGQKAFAFNVGIGQVVRGWDEGELTETPQCGE